MKVISYSLLVLVSLGAVAVNRFRVSGVPPAADRRPSKQPVKSKKKLKIFSQRRQGAKIINILNVFLCEFCAFARDKLNVVSHECGLWPNNGQSDQRKETLKKRITNIE
ncbi:hypothetical protein JY97_04855 [Alkalispirochaeta odontotermitis]|nr:hypothetical protein JY97_04855 [Alkalispirochaeta odontotermitis]CAB1069966.1 hypothetical protein D1AOALGA4SA_798 [Olavius algarvensis Delta 1 endosymbiont]